MLFLALIHKEDLDNNGTASSFETRFLPPPTSTMSICNLPYHLISLDSFRSLSSQSIQGLLPLPHNNGHTQPSPTKYLITHFSFITTLLLGHEQPYRALAFLFEVNDSLHTLSEQWTDSHLMIVHHKPGPSWSHFLHGKICEMAKIFSTLFSLYWANISMCRIWI